MEDNLNLKSLRERISGGSVPGNLKLLSDLFTGKIVFTTSFGAEDQVITHHIFSNNLPIKVATLDTGRLMRETYETFSDTIIKYHSDIRVYFPRHEDVEKLVSEKRTIQLLFIDRKQERML